MVDNTIQTGSDTIRDIDRGPAKTQVMQLDVGGQLQESLVSSSTAVPTDGVPADAGQSPDIPYYTSLVGDPGGDFAGVNILEELVKDNSGLALGVRIANLKQDNSNALILSDAPMAIPLSGSVGAGIIIDTTGYQSLNITTQALAGFVTTSNDGNTWSALTGVPLILGAYLAQVTANAGFSFPVLARFIKIAVTTAGTGTAYLRATPCNMAYTTSVPTANANNNVAQLNGFGVVNAGVNGTLAVGGNIAPGSAPTVNPLTTGGVDASGLVRRVLTDTSGRTQVADIGVDATATQRQKGVMLGVFGVPNTLMQDATQYEGKMIPELLAQILLELQIANQQRAEMLSGSFSSDDPSVYRADPSIFS